MQTINRCSWSECHGHTQLLQVYWQGTGVQPEFVQMPDRPIIVLPDQKPYMHACQTNNTLLCLAVRIKSMIELAECMHQSFSSLVPM